MMIRKQNSLNFNRQGQILIPSDGEPQKTRPDHIIKLVTPGHATEDQVIKAVKSNWYNLIIIWL
jgi:hypothetical protein